ncbi:ABC transporter substrate-binding protein [Patescibacteria group bacterium]|nr:ABC transporter substrate-binding protein [Patescibacteria group bacterium]
MEDDPKQQPIDTQPASEKKSTRFNLSLILIILFTLLLTAGAIFYSNNFKSNNKDNKNSVAVKKELNEVRIGLVAGLENSLETNFYPNTDPNMPESAVITQFLQPMVYFDNNYKIQPLLAQSWQTINPTTWRFNLRQDVKFSNGDQFSAEDVKFTIDTIKENAAKAKGKTPTWDTIRYVSDIESVKVVSPYVLDITTNTPSWSLLSKLAGVYIISRNTFKITDTQPPIGTGPYILQTVKKGDPVVLVRNENYWGEKAKVKKVIYQVISDETKRVQALENKEADLIEYVPYDRIDQLKKDPKYNVVIAPNLMNVWFVGMDYQRDKSPYVDTPKNPFKDLRVRQAVSYAIDINQLIQNTYKGFAFVQTQIVSNNIFGFNPDIQRLPFDLQKAKQLLTEAGYPNGFKVNIDAPHPRTAGYAQEVARQLKNIGIDATVKIRRQNETSAEDRAKYKAGDTSMYFTAAYVDGGNAQTTLGTYLHTRTPDQKWGTGNYGFYSNPKVDTLIEKAITEMDDAKRLAGMQEAMKIAIVDDIAYIPLNTDGIGVAFRKGISWAPRPDGRINAYEIAGTEGL